MILFENLVYRYSIDNVNTLTLVCRCSIVIGDRYHQKNLIPLVQIDYFCSINEHACNSPIKVKQTLPIDMQQNDLSRFAL